jgi:hypothetical protein
MKELLFAALGFLAVSDFATDTNLPASTKRWLNWWRQARVGMFIHYGLVSLTGQKDIPISTRKSNDYWLAD